MSARQTAYVAVQAASNSARDVSRASTVAVCRRAVSMSAVTSSAAAAARSPSAVVRTLEDANAYLEGVKGYKVGKTPVVLYDGVCNLCNGGVAATLRLDRQRKFRYAALQSTAGQALLVRAGRDPEDLSTMVVIGADGKTAHIMSDAVLTIGKELGFPLNALAMIVALLTPKKLRDYIYMNGLSKNRYSLFGKRDECTLVHPSYNEQFIHADRAKDHLAMSKTK
ncbi:DCC family protein [Porphyridium purpureum]|uniref:DCC family protein n=1 Tax=Porphyridium purpureum TaxID=35688 RepID=A0A5J4YRR9_PORPP|nr:DCC family protein [Porphyridium purpureum]|eukprot:POR6692..scf229_5